MRLSVAIDHFIRHVRTERGLSPNTTKAYDSDLASLNRYLTHHGRESLRIQDLTTLHLKDFIAHLRDDQQFRPRSLGRVMSSLRLFFEFCRKQEWIEASPAHGLRNPKVPRRLPVYMVDEEVVRLLRAPDRADALGVRDHTILVCFLFTGMRLSELVELDVESVDFRANTVLVRGKGSKERLLPLHRLVAVSLENYLSGRCSGPLFLTEEGGRMTSRMVGYVVEKSVKAAGVSHRITPHKLRHTFATQLLHKGASLLEIKELLGHSQLATTSIYTHTNVERLRNAVEKIDR